MQLFSQNTQTNQLNTGRPAYATRGYAILEMPQDGEVCPLNQHIQADIRDNITAARLSFALAEKPQEKLAADTLYIFALSKSLNEVLIARGGEGASVYYDDLITIGFEPDEISRYMVQAMRHAKEAWVIDVNTPRVEA